MSISELKGPRAASPLRKVLRSRAQLLLPDGTSFEVRTVDVAAGGLSVISKQAFTAGGEYSLVFKIPVQGALQTLTADVKIVYVSSAGADGMRLGLRFMTPDPLRTRLIEALH